MNDRLGRGILFVFASASIFGSGCGGSDEPGRSHRFPEAGSPGCGGKDAICGGASSAGAGIGGAGNPADLWGGQSGNPSGGGSNTGGRTHSGGNLSLGGLWSDAGKGGDAEASGGSAGSAEANGGTAEAGEGGRSHSGGNLNGGEGGAGQGGGGEGGAGQGGEHSIECSPVARHACDDGNDCTIDSCDLEVGCQHQPRADGSTCDDGRACTVRDRCSGGVCAGEAVTSDARVISELDSFGGYEEGVLEPNVPQGLSAALSDELLVFAEPAYPGLSIKLVRVEAQGLTLLDRALSYASLRVEGGGLFSRTLGTHLVALSSTRVALVSSSYAIEIFDAVGGKLVGRSYRFLRTDGLDQSIIRGAAGHGNRLWLLSTRNAGYDVALDGTLTPLATVSSAAGTGASALAISKDNNTLYVGAQSGIFRVDVSDPLHPVQDSAPVISEPTERRPYQLEVHGGYLLVQDEALYNSPGDLRIFRESGFEQVAAFAASPATAPSPTFSTGAVFVDQGLLLQRLHYDSHGPKALVAELYALDQNGTTLRDQWEYRDLALLDNTLPWQPLRPVAADHLAIVGPTRRVVWAEDGKLSERKGERQGTFERVVAAEGNRILGYGSESTHLIDLGDPNQPIIASGGLLDPGTSSLLRVDVPGSSFSYPKLLNTGSPLLASSLWKTRGGLVTQFGYDSAEAPAAVGSFRIEGNAGQTASSGLLYRVSPADDSSWQLDVFELPRTAAWNLSPSAIESARLQGSVPATAGPVLVAADTIGRNLLVASQDPSQSAMTLDWFSRESDSWQFVSGIQVPQSDLSNTALLLFRDSAFVARLNSSQPPARLDRIGRHGSQLTIEDTVPIAGLRNLLGVEADRIYVVVSQADAQTKVDRALVQALAVDTLQPVASYPVSQIPSSMTTADDLLVFGARTELFVASPHCP